MTDTESERLKTNSGEGMIEIKWKKNKVTTRNIYSKMCIQRKKMASETAREPE